MPSPRSPKSGGSPERPNPIFGPLDLSPLMLSQTSDFSGRSESTNSEKALMHDTLNKKSWGRRSVSRYWLDKLFAFVVYLQIAGICWTNLTGFMPALLVNAAKILTLFNLDPWLLLGSDGLDYRAWAAVWTAVPPVLLVLYAAASHCAPPPAVGATAGGQMARRAHLQWWFTSAAMLLYVPFAVAISRLVVCEEDGTLLVMPDVACWSRHHLSSAIPAGVVTGLYLLGLPAWLWREVGGAVLYHGSDDHICDVEMREAEYILELDDTWMTSKFFFFSSFKRRFVHFWVCVMLGELLLVVLFSVTAVSLDIRVLAVLCTLGGAAALVSVSQPFRSQTSSIFFMVALWTNFANMAVFFLVSSEVQSPLLVASAVSVWFLLINCMGGVFFLLALTFATYRWIRGGGWPVTRATVEEDMRLRGEKHVAAVAHLRDAAVVLERLRETRDALVDPVALANLIACLQEDLHTAAANADPLQRTLDAQLQVMVELYLDRAPRGVTLLSYRPLQLLMPALVVRLAAREEELRLMPAIKKRILLKLYALACLVNGRKWHFDAMRKYDSDGTPSSRSLTPQSAPSAPSSAVTSSDSEVEDSASSEGVGALLETARGLAGTPTPQVVVEAVPDDDNDHGGSAAPSPPNETMGNAATRASLLSVADSH